MRSSWTMMKLRTGLALGALGLSLGTAVGCTVTNLNHCGLNAGACGEGMACSMCAIENDGCVPQGTPLLEEACAFVSASSEPGTTGPQTTTTQPTTVAPTDTSEDGTGTTFDTTTNPGTA